VVEVVMRRNNGGGLDHVTGRSRTHRGPHVARFRGADVEEREGVMMMTFKRPHFLTPRQRAHQHHEGVWKREVGKKRQDIQEEEKKHREEEMKETENGVLKKIRKFMANF